MRPEVLRMPVRILSKINKMTSYQQRKTEIRELKERILMLESLLSDHGIYLGQLTINDNKKMSIPKPPLPPPGRIVYSGSPFFIWPKWIKKSWKWLKWQLAGLRAIPSPIVSDAFHENQTRFAELRTKELFTRQTEEADNFNRSLAKLNYEAKKFGQSIHRLSRRKKRYSISTPIVRAWK